jgi:hypothetical protein
MTQTIQDTPAFAVQPTVSAPTATVVEEAPARTPESSILTETREAIPLKPATLPASAAGVRSSVTTLATASVPIKKDTKPAPPWLREMRQKLANCNALGLIEKLVCIDQTRKKHCAPSHWGEVEECRLNNGLADD